VGLLLALFVVFVLGIALFSGKGTISNRDISWISGDSAGPSESACVYAHYLLRHRHHRFAGGAFGVLFAGIVGVRYYARVSIGVGQQTPLADVLFCGLAGVLLGALSAESYRLSEPRNPWSTASLVTTKTKLQNKVKLSRSVAVLCPFGGFVYASSGQGWSAFFVGLVGLLVVLLAELTTRAINGRKRAVLSDQAHVVDNRLRFFATNSVGWLQLAVALLSLAWSLSKVLLPKTWVADVQIFVVSVVLVGSVVCLRKGAPRPPRRWSKPAS
jgi:hypothetical protein